MDRGIHHGRPGTDELATTGIDSRPDERTFARGYRRTSALDGHGRRGQLPAVGRDPGRGREVRAVFGIGFRLGLARLRFARLGLGFWFGYAISRDRLFAAIGLGVLLGAICAGLSLFTVNTRAAAGRAPGADSSAENPGTASLSFSPRLLILHAVGAALTLLFVALIAARVT